ncbi:MAG: tRNA uridine-5-carboxymethylaminomethyl(34) synthesis GTPase MnmE [Legionellales bacterium]|nr:tRNA uridine-5-carboxymethylaminomethyl(34) synthesis GTPase MnmE [Legionellales bacterium]
MGTTIAAIATPLGRGGIGIVRISGPLALDIGQVITQQTLTPRQAAFSTFQNSRREAIDEGIALYFKAPHSFTGEDIVELQGHGGVAVLQQVLEAACEFGAEIAKPGEFSERAFLNGKMDLIQAEAVADLIDAGSTQAAQSALRSLQGEFSEAIQALNQKIIHVRVMLESALDFSDEEIPLIEAQQVEDQLVDLVSSTENTIHLAQQGSRLQTGLSVVILGKPNVGKSSLLNCLAKRDAAIVTDIAGTTRDVLQESIHIQGMPLHVIDTAGLRETDDVIEQEGVRRAWQHAEQADVIVWVLDSSQVRCSSTELMEQYQSIQKQASSQIPIAIVLNKIDLDSQFIIPNELSRLPQFMISAKFGKGLSDFMDYLLSVAGLQQCGSGIFSARARHIQALQKALSYVQQSLLICGQIQAYELVAEELKLAQHSLGKITGQVTSDDLLGEIFSTFCIGK